MLVNLERSLSFSQACESIRNCIQQDLTNDRSIFVDQSTGHKTNAGGENETPSAPAADAMANFASQRIKKFKKIGNSVLGLKKQFQSSKKHKNLGGHVLKNTKRQRETDGSDNEGGAAGKDLSHIQCFKCKKYGHYQRNCTKKKQRGDDAGDSAGAAVSESDLDLLNSNGVCVDWDCEVAN